MTSASALGCRQGLEVFFPLSKILAVSDHHLAVLFVIFKFKVLFAPILNALDHFRHQPFEVVDVRIRLLQGQLLSLAHSHLWPRLGNQCKVVGDVNTLALCMALRLTGLVLGPNLDGQALGVTASVMHGFLSQQRVLETDLLALGVEVFSDRTI